MSPSKLSDKTICTSPLKSLSDDELARVLAAIGDDVTAAGSARDSELLPWDVGIATDPMFLGRLGSIRVDFFQKWQFESLLDQAADILERVLRDQSAHDSLRFQWLKLNFEVLEFRAIRDVHDQEITNGLYCLDAIESEAELKAQQELSTAANAAQAELVAAVTGSDPDKIALLASRIGKFSQFNTYAGQHAAGVHPQAPTVAPCTGLPAGVPVYDVGFGHNGEIGIVNDDRVVFDGKGTAKSQYISDKTSDLARISAMREQKSLKAQQIETEGGQRAAAARIDGRAARAIWTAANQDFRRRRDEIAIEMNDLKTLAMRADGGAYNLLLQMREVRARMVADFADAKVRLDVAAQGLREIIGYNDPLPPVDVQRPFSQYLMWVRRAIKTVVAFGQGDQGYARSFSLRQLAGGPEFDERLRQAVESNEDPLILRFSLDESTFPFQRHIRLRGLGVTLFGIPEGAEYGVTLAVPRHASIRHVGNGLDHPEKPAQLDQATVPLLRYGRARLMSDVRDADVAGTMTLRNISPLGWHAADFIDKCWIAMIDRAATIGTDLLASAAQFDVLITFYIAARLPSRGSQTFKR